MKSEEKAGTLFWQKLKERASKKENRPGRVPWILAPLAGVSDWPFRRMCEAAGADLTYVEMLSAAALIQKNEKTWAMAERHPDEQILGVQLTGRTADETAEAVALLDEGPYDTIDINMGCPVQKIVKTGCGSAILREPERVFETAKKCRAATRKPLSAKIRLGWNEINAQETVRALAEGGVDWICVHGRLRSEDYGSPVRLDVIADLKAQVDIPLVANGNLLSAEHVAHAVQKTGCDAVMISRGALGNPWIFNGIADLSLEQWYQDVRQHLEWQRDAYARPEFSLAKAAVCMRKNLLWYPRGWPQTKPFKEAVQRAETIEEMLDILASFYRLQVSLGHKFRPGSVFSGIERDFGVWDPKYEMDRELDRGVGHLGL